MDTFLKDLEKWKQNRAIKQDLPVDSGDEDTKESESKEELRKIEEQFMQKANEREREILEKLKALNIDPVKEQEYQNQQFYLVEAQ